MGRRSERLSRQGALAHEAAGESGDTDALMESIDRMDQLGAWDFDAKIKQIFSRLNIEHLIQPVKNLSGGQRKRVALARTLIDIGFGNSEVFLIMDEPTNHLDIEMVEWLENYINQQNITLLVVSHDRYFLDNVANKIWFIEDHKIVTYPGTYVEYDDWYSKRKLQPKAVPAPKTEKKEEKKDPVAAKKPDDEKSKQLKKLNQELSGMEQQIEELEKTVKGLETQLADDKLYTDATKAQQVTETYQLKKLALKEVQAKWENLAEHIMELEA